MDLDFQTWVDIISAIVVAIATVFIAIFGYQTMRAAQASAELAERMNFLSGALESHSHIQLMIEAKKNNMEMVWWDPTKEPVPDIPKHGEPVDKSKIYFYLPEELRVGKKKLKYTLPRPD